MALRFVFALALIASPFVLGVETACFQYGTDCARCITAEGCIFCSAGSSGGACVPGAEAASLCSAATGTVIDAGNGVCPSAGACNPACSGDTVCLGGSCVGSCEAHSSDCTACLKDSKCQFCTIENGGMCHTAGDVASSSCTLARGTIYSSGQTCPATVACNPTCQFPSVCYNGNCTNTGCARHGSDCGACTGDSSCSFCQWSANGDSFGLCAEKSVWSTACVGSHNGTVTADINSCSSSQCNPACASGQTCDKGICISAETCESLDCGSCAAHSSCGWCPGPDANSNNGAGCMARSGTCDRGLITTAASCPAGSVCTPGCVVPAKCENGICVTPGEQCSPACASGMSCVNSACFWVGQCGEACGDGSTCVVNIGTGQWSCSNKAATCSPACNNTESCIWGQCHACSVCGDLGNNNDDSLLGSVAGSFNDDLTTIQTYKQVTLVTNQPYSVTSGGLERCGDGTPIKITALTLGDDNPAGSCGLLVSKSNFDCQTLRFRGSTAGLILQEFSNFTTATTCTVDAHTSAFVTFDVPSTNTNHWNNTFDCSNGLQLDGVLQLAGPGHCNFGKEGSVKAGQNGMIVCAGGCALQGDLGNALVMVGGVFGQSNVCTFTSTAEVVTVVRNEILGRFGTVNCAGNMTITSKRADVGFTILPGATLNIDSKEFSCGPIANDGNLVVVAHALTTNGTCHSTQFVRCSSGANVTVVVDDYNSLQSGHKYVVFRFDTKGGSDFGCNVNIRTASGTLEAVDRKGDNNGRKFSCDWEDNQLIILSSDRLAGSAATHGASFLTVLLCLVAFLYHMA